MLQAIIEKNQVRKLNKRLMKALEPYRDFYDRRRIHYPQGHRDENISFSEKLGMWWYNDIIRDVVTERYWNCFGLDNPTSKESVTIACEINMPLEGVNLRTGGLWAKGENNKFYLLHSGKIGGGSKGVGKQLFLDNFKAYQLKPVNVDGRLRDYALVTALDAPNIGEQIARFIKEISRIKSIPRNVVINTSDLELQDYSPEFSGQKRYSLPERIVTANCDHGLIVDALETELRNLGLSTGSNRNIDLYTKSASRITRIFEIKSGLCTQTLYTAIGQLLLNSVSIKPLPPLFFVCPKNIKPTLVSDLFQLNISVITYDWKNNLPRFNNINKYFTR